ncbi:hypothetical protein JC606_21605 [Vibrio sp. IB15]|uniref:hypothetical protein n=1 Tax=Vibrio sp. IB15 TaxID=2779368 RepID=UPI0018E6ED01|nr:hypothetical protein [Vibrio sp. IB15]MBJ2148936.1 hypothetical protein [Vibrio sp. IB15]
MFTVEKLRDGYLLKNNFVRFYKHPDLNFTYVSFGTEHSPISLCMEFSVKQLQFDLDTIGEEHFHSVKHFSSIQTSPDRFTYTFENDQELEQFCSFYGLKLPTNSLCTLCMNNFTSQTVCKECDSALKLANKLA